MDVKGAGKERRRALERAGKERRDALAREKQQRRTYTSRQRLPIAITFERAREERERKERGREERAAMHHKFGDGGGAGDCPAQVRPSRARPPVRATLLRC